jgi:peptidase M28-like protein/PA domain-containing protein
MKKVLPLAVVCALLCAPPAFGTGSSSDSKKLRDAVGVKGMLVHEAALNTIGELANGNRLAGTKGYDASSLYVGVNAALGGLKVSQHKFDYDLDILADWKQPILKVTTRGKQRSFNPGIGGAQFAFGGDFGSNYGTQSTDITAPVWAADVRYPAGPTANGNTSGCELDDYAGMPAGAIIVVQRGTCAFAQKFALAEQVGAGAMLISNEGNVPEIAGRTLPIWFDVTGLQTPSAAVTVETAAALANGVQKGLTGLTARVRIDWRPGTYPTQNIVAETKTGDPNKVIVVGAHLDSVGTGSGINDNGSGSAALLELAEHINKMKLRNKVRFVWFSAEESGLLGSTAYVASLDDVQRSKIAAMLNFDMIASPNFARFVYDGDQGSFPPGPGDLVAPPGSDEIEKLFLDYFAGQGLANEPTAFDGRSDYGPFIEAGIPAGGLFTGAEELKTPAQVALYGGTAGQPFDICYHQGCDDFFNLNKRGYEEMADAAAHVLVTLAQAKTLPARSAPVAAAAARSVAKTADVHGLSRPAAPADAGS